MTFQDYLLHLFYLVDAECEAPSLGRPRRRGPRPTLHDSEVLLTMELAGEFPGIDTDKGIYGHFRRHHLREFPALARVRPRSPACARVRRASFARQAGLADDRRFALLAPHKNKSRGTPRRPIGRGCSRGCSRGCAARSRR